MNVLYSRCCGIDVHKDSVTACVRVDAGNGNIELRKKEFAAHRPGLELLRLWLYAQKVQQVGLESTGVYWKPVWKALEGHFPLILANPFQVKNLPGCKTDARDSAWLADLVAHGLMRASFVPQEETRNLRDLTRLRTKRLQEYNRLHNRIHKVLEDACVKLDMVASDILGASGRAMINAIIRGQEDARWLADYAKGTLRRKRNELKVVLRGRVTEHHRWLLAELMEDVDHVEGQIARLDEQIAKSVDQEKVARLMTIPGVDLITACILLAELGPDMKAFDSPQHAASWVGLCPGNHESAGKRLSNRTRKGNRWLRSALPIGLGCDAKEELLFSRVFPAPDDHPRSAKSHSSDGTQDFADRVLHAERWNAISREGRQLLRHVASTTDPKSADPEASKVGRGRHSEAASC
jgi:transposase